MTELYISNLTHFIVAFMIQGMCVAIFNCLKAGHPANEGLILYRTYVANRSCSIASQAQHNDTSCIKYELLARASVVSHVLSVFQLTLYAL